MPFRSSRPHSFQLPSVLTHAPAQSGIYGISNAGRWIYIAETDDIRSALLLHLQDASGFLRPFSPTGFSFELSEPVVRDSRCARLIWEFSPVGNETASADTVTRHAEGS